MPPLHLLRVFCSDDGSGGNPLGVFLDGAEVPPERRQAVAADLGLSEMVFVDDAERGEVRIFTPAVELDFAGHPTVGTAWLLEGADVLRVPGGRARRSAATASWCTWPPGRSGDRRTSSSSSARRTRSMRSTGRPADTTSPRPGRGSTRRRATSARGRSRCGSASPRTRPPARRPRSCARSSGARSTSGRGAARASSRDPATDGFVEIGGRSALDDVRDYALP